MSRIAVISDIHANATALGSVLEDAHDQEVTSFACLGDIVGYGPDPSECVRRIQGLNCITIKGNHDEYIADGYDLSKFNDEATAALQWTRSQLSNSQKNWLTSLPYTRRLGRNSLVHASLDEPEGWHYITNRLDASLHLKNQKVLITFCGHTHRPAAYKYVDGSTTKLENTTFEIDFASKYMINVGSVGQPRDGDSRSSYIIFDRAARTIEFRRVNYDITITAEKIKSSELPNSLAKRLFEAD